MSRFIHPVSSRITQQFGENPAYYSQYGQKGHTGIDYGAFSGTPVRAAADGTVVMQGNGSNDERMGRVAGIVIILDHINVLTGYAHLKKSIVSEGQKVTQGQVIGYTGNTGGNIGQTLDPHLHFEFITKPWNKNNGYYGRLNPSRFFQEPPTVKQASKVTVAPATKKEEIIMAAAEVEDLKRHIIEGRAQVEDLKKLVIANDDTVIKSLNEIKASLKKQDEKIEDLKMHIMELKK